jgi:hypothetical protein
VKLDRLKRVNARLEINNDKVLKLLGVADVLRDFVNMLSSDFEILIRELVRDLESSRVRGQRKQLRPGKPGRLDCEYSRSLQLPPGCLAHAKRLAELSQHQLPEL